MKPYLHSLSILASFLLVFAWEGSDFARYSIPFIGFLIFMFLLISIKNKQNLNLGGPVNFFILNTVLLLFIFSTGGMESNLFFILYFLLFAAAFIMNPKSVFIFPIGVVIVFWSTLFQNDTTANLLKISGVVLLTPLAYFFGKQFKKNEKAEDENLKRKERAASAGEEISEETEDVLESASGKLTPEEKEKLEEVLEEADDLRDEK